MGINGIDLGIYVIEFLGQKIKLYFGSTPTFRTHYFTRELAKRKKMKAFVIIIGLIITLAFAPFLLGFSSEGTLVMPPEDDNFLDTTFGTNGKAVTPVGIAQAVAIQPDGKVVAAGYAFNGTNNDFAILRYNQNGTLDDTFDGTTNANGRILTPVGQFDEEAFGIAIQSDGKIVLVGQTYDGAKTNLAFIRYNADGTLDNSFDGDGRVIVSPSVGNALLRSVAVRPDGRIVAAGVASNGLNFDIVVVQLNANGSLDQTFVGNSGNSNGVVTTAVGTANDQAYGVGIRPDGKIVVAGYLSTATGTDSLLLRYQADGRLDTSFSGDGIMIHSFSPDTDEALALALMPDGRIVIAGCIRNGAPNDFLIGRFTEDGSVDPAFGTNGAIMMPFSSTVDISLGVAVQPDGKVVAVGFGNNGINNDFAVTRINTNGTPDLTFGGDGRILTAIGTSADQANAVAIQPDGKIVVAGRTAGTTADVAIVRYQSGFVSITGRVTSPNGTALRNTSVMLIDENGLSQTASSSSFGIYEFRDVPIGRTYTLRAASKRYRFAPRILAINESLSGMDLIGLE